MPPRDEVPLVDSHFHIWKKELPLTATSWRHEVTDASVERLIALLDQHGILFGVVAGASVHGTYNDYVRAALRKHRRLRATAIVDPSIDIYQLERMRDDGFVGIRLMWAFSDEAPDLNSDDYRRLLRRVADLDWHVHIADRPDRLPATIAAVERAGVKLVLDHLGYAETPDGINGEGFKAMLAAVERGSTWVKLSGGFRFQSPAIARQYAVELVKFAGGDRLFWASDWPFTAFETSVTYEETLAAFKDWVPDDSLRRKIGGETPLRFYFG